MPRKQDICWNNIKFIHSLKRQSHYVRQLSSNLYISRLHFHPLALVTRGTPQYHKLLTNSLPTDNTLLYDGTHYKLLTGSPPWWYTLKTTHWLSSSWWYTRRRRGCLSCVSWWTSLRSSSDTVSRRLGLCSLSASFFSKMNTDTSCTLSA